MSVDTAYAGEREPAIRFLVNLLIRPAKAFTALRERGTRGWLWVGLMVLIFTVTTIVVAAPLTRRMVIENIRQVQVETPAGPRPAPAHKPGNPPPPTEVPPNVTHFVTSPFFTIIMPSVGAILAILLGWLVWAGVLHLLAIFIGGKSTFGRMFQGVVAADFPAAWRGLLQTLYVASTHKIIQNPGLSGLVPINQRPTEVLAHQVPVTRLLLHQLLQQIDIFQIWRLFLLGLAVWAIAKLNKRRAYLLVIGVWVLITLLTLLPAFLSYALFSRTFGGM